MRLPPKHLPIISGGNALLRLIPGIAVAVGATSSASASKCSFTL